MLKYSDPAENNKTIKGGDGGLGHCGGSGDDGLPVRGEPQTVRSRRTELSMGELSEKYFKVRYICNSPVPLMEDTGPRLISVGSSVSFHVAEVFNANTLFPNHIPYSS